MKLSLVAKLVFASALALIVPVVVAADIASAYAAEGAPLAQHGASVEDDSARAASSLAVAKVAPRAAARPYVAPQVVKAAPARVWVCGAPRALDSSALTVSVCEWVSR